VDVLHTLSCDPPVEKTNMKLGRTEKLGINKGEKENLKGNAQALEGQKRGSNDRLCKKSGARE